MTTLGWVMMIASNASVLSLVCYCLYRVLTLPPVETESLDVAPLRVDTRDTKNAD